MPSLQFTLFCLILCHLYNGHTAKRIAKSAWNYDRLGPDQWPNVEDNKYGACASSYQSPINISAEDVICVPNKLKPVILANYGNNANFNFTNTALTILGRAQITSNTLFQFSGSGYSQLFAPFDLVQFHFHWGSDNSEGSEHVINDVGSPLELHLVHVSRKDPNYYAVIGIMFQISKNDNPNLKTIIDAANFLALNENSSIVKEVNVYALIPKDLNAYYYYEGSLTTPPCTERVFWTVLYEKIGISEKQLQSFRSNPIKKNFRPTQPLNERSVYTRTCQLAAVSAANTFECCKFYNLIILVSAYVLIQSLVALF